MLLLELMESALGWVLALDWGRALDALFLLGLSLLAIMFTCLAHGLVAAGSGRASVGEDAKVLFFSLFVAIVVYFYAHLVQAAAVYVWNAVSLLANRW